MNKWFISDLHLGHENIIKYCNRPFSNVEEMDKTIIRNWNERVDDGDTVFHVGDFCLTKSSEAPNAPKNAFEYYKEQLKGNIVFLKGNHDKTNHTEAIIESMVIQYGGQRIYLTHNPKFYNTDFRFNFVGHVHNEYKFKKIGEKTILVNLSADQWEFRPISINEIDAAYHQWLKRGKGEHHA